MYYEAKIRYTKQTGEDNPKKVTEMYVIEDVCFGGAENSLLDKLMPSAYNGDIEVVAIKVVKPFDIVHCKNAEKVFKCKLDLIIIDADKESRKRVFVYVGAPDLESARRTIEDTFKSYDCELIAVEETKIVEVVYDGTTRESAIRASMNVEH